MECKVYTQGACFMCLKRLGEDDDDNPLHHHHGVNSFKLLTTLTKYLKLDLGGVLNNRATTTTTTTTTTRLSSEVGTVGGGGGGGGGADVVVPLCVGCGGLASKFSELVQRLELLGLEADDVVREIHGVMVAAGGGGGGGGGEDKKDLVRKDSPRRAPRRRSTRRGQQQGNDFVGPGLTMDKFRKEVIEKCSNLVDRRVPRGMVLHHLQKDCQPGAAADDDDDDDDDSSVLQGSPDEAASPEADDSFHGNANVEDAHEDDDDDEIKLVKIVVNNRRPSSGPKSAKVATSDPQMSFKLLPHGSKVQCGLCSKQLVNKKSILRRHKLFHSGVKPFKCHQCASKSFQYSANLWDHKYKMHRSTLFAKYKEPSLTPDDQFEKTLAKLFDSILQIPEVGNNGSGTFFKCNFCGRDQFKTKVRVQSHFVRHHMEELVPRLEELQKSSSVPPHPPGQPPSASKTPAQGQPGSFVKCQYCKKLLFGKNALVSHIQRVHRVTHFLKFKDAKYSSEEFQRLIDHLFNEQIPVPRQSNGEFMCVLCRPKVASWKSPSHVQVHWVQKHLAELVSRVKGLQAAGDEFLHQSEEDSLVQQKEEKPAIPAPPPPPPVASAEDSDHGIPFKLLPGGKYQCGICPNKRFPNKSSFKSHHKLVHSGGSSSLFKCNLCDSSFLDPRNLRGHKYWKHGSLVVGKLICTRQFHPQSDSSTTVQVQVQQNTADSITGMEMEVHPALITSPIIIGHNNNPSNFNNISHDYDDKDKFVVKQEPGMELKVDEEEEDGEKTTQGESNPLVVGDDDDVSMILGI